MKFDQDKDENTLSRRAFAIEKSKAEVVNGIPVSGEDYLLLVRQQAEKCVQTVTAPPPQQIKQLDLPFEYQFTKDTTTNSDLIPDPEWQKSFVSCFESFRTKQQNAKHTVKSTSAPTTNQQWRTHCTQSSLDDTRLLETIAPLSQKTILKLLKLNMEWLQSPELANTDLDHDDESTWSRHTLWIFSLLVYLDPVLTSMDISILRDLCRACIDLRNHYHHPHDERVMKLNIIITIISVSFGQSDLH